MKSSEQLEVEERNNPTENRPVWKDQIEIEFGDLIDGLQRVKDAIYNDFDKTSKAYCAKYPRVNEFLDLIAIGLRLEDNVIKTIKDSFTKLQWDVNKRLVQNEFQFVRDLREFEGIELPASRKVMVYTEGASKRVTFVCDNPKKLKSLSLKHNPHLLTSTISRQISSDQQKTPNYCKAEKQLIEVIPEKSSETSANEAVPIEESHENQNEYRGFLEKVVWCLIRR